MLLNLIHNLNMNLVVLFYSFCWLYNLVVIFNNFLYFIQFIVIYIKFFYSRKINLNGCMHKQATTPSPPPCPPWGHLCVTVCEPVYMYLYVQYPWVLIQAVGNKLCTLVNGSKAVGSYIWEPSLASPCWYKFRGNHWNQQASLQSVYSITELKCIKLD